jgi:hypothetical protein
MDLLHEVEHSENEVVIDSAYDLMDVEDDLTSVPMFVEVN